MLTLTPTAVEAVRQLVAAAPIDEDGGIRISGEQTPDGAILQLTLVDAPEVSDESVDEAGAHVFLEPSAAEFLDDKILDVEQGEGGPTFTIKESFDPGTNGHPPD